MTLKNKLFKTINDHIKESIGDENLTVEQILELIIVVNEFNAEWLDEANDFIKEK